MLCSAPVPVIQNHEIGDRKITVDVTTDWGDSRPAHDKSLAFCSFKCLAAWASKCAEAHDGRVVACMPKRLLRAHAPRATTNTVALSAKTSTTTTSSLALAARHANTNARWTYE